MLACPEPGVQRGVRDVRHAPAQHGRRARRQAVRVELELAAQHAPHVEQDAAGQVQAAGVQLAPLVVLHVNARART